MTARLYVDKVGGGQIDLTSFTGRKGAPFFDGSTPLINMGMRYANGEASQGTFKLVDPAGEVARADFAYNLPAHKRCIWTEDAAGCEYWLAAGRLSSYEGGRGVAKADADVEYDNTVDDANIELRYQPFTEDWVRPEETDYERIIALQAYTLNGASSTATHSRVTCEVYADDSHFCKDANTVTMPAKTYPIGTQPQEVIQDCADAAGKQYGVVIHHGAGFPPETASEIWSVNYADGVNDTWTDGCSGLGGALFGDVMSNPLHGCAGMGNARHFDASQYSGWIACDDTTLTFNMRIARRGTGTYTLYIKWLPSLADCDPSGPPNETVNLGAVGNGFSDTCANNSWSDKTVVLDPPAGTIAVAFTYSFDGAMQTASMSQAATSTGCSHQCLQYIIPEDLTTNASVVKISDQISEWDPDNLTAPVFEPIFDMGKPSIFDGQELTTALVSRYGTDTSAAVFVEDTAATTSYDYWGDVYNDDESQNPTEAAARASAILGSRTLTHITHRVSILMRADQLHLINGGMAVQFKAAAMIAGTYLDTWQTRRVAECKFEPASPLAGYRESGSTTTLYWAHLNLDRPPRSHAVRAGKAAPSATTPQVATDMPYDPTASGLAATDVGAAIDELAAAMPPNSADYLVGTANAGLSAEIVVGTSPGGELGGTWASPTVDSTHAGSNHLQPVRKNSTGSVFTRRQLNFIEGSNVTLTVADDAGNDEVDITVAASGTGGTVVVEELDGSPSVAADTIKFPNGSVTDNGDGSVSVATGGTATTGIDWIDSSTNPDKPPGSPNSQDDEFNAGSLDAKWTQTGGASAPTFSGGMLHVFAPSAGSTFLTQTYTPGASTAFTFRVKFTGFIFVANTDLVGIRLEQSDGTNICSLDYRGSSGIKIHKDVVAVGTDVGLAFGAPTIYLEIARDASDVWTYRISHDGLLWSSCGMATNTTSTTVGKVSIRIATTRAVTNFGSSVDWFRRTA